MKRIMLLYALLILFPTISLAQIYNPVIWEFNYETISENRYEIVFKASIEAGSHIYGLDVPAGGPLPTAIRFGENSNYSLEGDIYEVTAAEESYDDAFGMNIKSYSGSVELRQKIKGDGNSFRVNGVVEYMACNNMTCSPLKEVEFDLFIPGANGSAGASETKTPSVSVSKNRGLLNFFFGSFILGLLGVITPCVYPMIPLTVAFFSRGSEQRRKSVIKALIFGISIVLIYTSPGIIISLTGAGAGFAGALGTHWIPNTIFFLLFVVFALSFFGLFEITLPGKWSTSVDSKVDKGGVVASFFMALTTVIVSFSCTGPIVGSLLVEAVRGDILRPTIGMLAFGFAFSIPFTVFALSPALLSKLPKSGSWLNIIKVVLGFLMLAFSLKFLMTIDSVYSLNILSRNLYIVIWCLIFLLLGLYLLGIIRFAHDSKSRSIGAVRIILAVCVFAFVAYLSTGLFGKPLKMVSAMLPPQKEKVVAMNQEETNLSNSILAFQMQPVGDVYKPKYSDLFTMPLGLKGFFDYEEGLAYAKKVGKPVLIDFKGHACANCKRMEARVWSDNEVLRRLEDNFVIISLYVDDRTELPENEWIVSSVDGKIKKTIGKINEELEISKYNTNTLPLYVIADHEGKPINTPSVTNLNVDEYIEWLDEGFNNFN